MNTMQKSEAIKNGLRKGFQDGSSKMAKRKCYGYEVGSDGELSVNPYEAQVVCWIFERYLAGDSLGKIAAGLERQGNPSPTGRLKWNREAIDKMLSNEKYTGRVLLQKTVSTGTVQTENRGLMDRYLYTGSHEAIISDEMFMAVQREKLSRSKVSQNKVAMRFTFCDLHSDIVLAEIFVQLFLESLRYLRSLYVLPIGALPTLQLTQQH